MRLFSITDDTLPGAFSAPTFSRFLMILHITSTIILTLTQTSEAASISCITKRSRHRSKIRCIRDAQRSGELKESLGERECSEDEKQQQGCLAGSCAALVTSKLHTFIICRCPPDRQGPRCEEVAINTDSIAEILKEETQEQLCKEEKYDIMTKLLGYETVFLDCVKKNYDSDIRVLRKQRLKSERDRKRQRKMRRRNKKKDKKKKNSSEKADTSTSSDDIDIRDGSSLSQRINTPQNNSDLTSTQREGSRKNKNRKNNDDKKGKKGKKDKNKKDRTNKNDKSDKNNKKDRNVRHIAGKKRRGKSVTMFLKGTPAALDVTTHPHNSKIIH